MRATGKCTLFVWETIRSHRHHTHFTVQYDTPDKATLCFLLYEPLWETLCVLRGNKQKIYRSKLIMVAQTNELSMFANVHTDKTRCHLLAQLLIVILHPALQPHLFIAEGCPTLFGGTKAHDRYCRPVRGHEV
jgi:hypothetical protein